MHMVFDARSIHRHMGGIGRAAADMVEAVALCPKEHTLSVILGSNLPEGFFPPDSVDLVRADAAMIDPPFEQLGLPGVLEEMKADVYVNSCFSLPALKTSRYQIPIVHDIVFEEKPEWVEPKLRGYLQHWSRFAVAHADRVITVSDYSRDRISAIYNIPKSRIKRIYNGISKKCFESPSEAVVGQIAGRYGLSRPYLLYLGTCEPKKGILELLDAFSQLAERGFAGDLVLVGGQGGPDFDLKGAITKTGCSGRIKSLGYVDETAKKALLAGCALFVYPSRYEGFGLPPLEAMALGKPCVVSTDTSVPEVVGDAAIKVDVDQRDAFVAALERGLNDEVFRQKALTAGPDRAREFTWERAAEEFLDLVESLEEN